MQIHLSRDILSIWRNLPPEIRRFIESLTRNPRPDDALNMAEQPNRYEDFISGYWIIWEIDDSAKETVIRVTISE
jgi:hypothetical protein